MNWREGKWCENCGALPVLVKKLLNNPGIEIYQCPACNRTYQYDNWTKAAKEEFPRASDDGHNAKERLV